MHSFNGMSLIINKGPDVILYTDACDVGAGGYGNVIISPG